LLINLVYPELQLLCLIKSNRNNTSYIPVKNMANVPKKLKSGKTAIFFTYFEIVIATPLREVFRLRTFFKSSFKAVDLKKVSRLFS